MALLREYLCVPVDRNGEQINVPILQPERPLEDQQFYLNGQVLTVLEVEDMDVDSNPPMLKVRLDTLKHPDADTTF